MKWVLATVLGWTIFLWAMQYRFESYSWAINSLSVVFLVVFCYTIRDKKEK